MKYVSKARPGERGFKAALFGTTATGKTTSIASLLLAGQNVRFLSADNNAAAGIQAGINLWKVSEEQQKNLAICIPDRQKGGFDSFLTQIDSMQSKEVETFLKTADKEKKNLTGFRNIVSGINKFTDTEGQDRGSVLDWGTDTTLIIDSLTEVCREIQHMVCGIKPPSLPEFNAMQGFLKTFISGITTLNCNVVLLAHPDKETDQVTGAVKIYLQSIGKALNESLPSSFSDVLYAQFDGKEYFWSTKHRQAVCSGRNVPISEKLPQDFRQFFILEK